MNLPPVEPNFEVETLVCVSNGKSLPPRGLAAQGQRPGAQGVISCRVKPWCADNRIGHERIRFIQLCRVCRNIWTIETCCHGASKPCCLNLLHLQHACFFLQMHGDKQGGKYGSPAVCF